MNLPIALAQFIMLALGVMASRILLTSGAIVVSNGPWHDRMAAWAGTHGLWLLAIPALWLLLTQGCTKLDPRWTTAMQNVGVGIAIVTLAIIVAFLIF